MKKPELFKTVVVDGVQFSDYMVDRLGNIWSLKGKDPIILKPNISGKSAKYPKVTLCSNGDRKTVFVHRLVCSAWHNFPTPNGINARAWKRTPSEVKSLLTSLFQVNHIDHNHKNFHPSNLEWVTVKENSQAWQSHKAKHGL
jgi:hypothetical protein